MKLMGHYGLLFLVFWPFSAAFISYLIGRWNKQYRDYFANLAVFLEFAAAIIMAFSASNEHPPVFQWLGFMGFRIYLTIDGFRCIYAVITSLMWLMTTLYSREYFAHYRNRNRYYFFMLLTLGGTMGVFLSADLITTFLFFEMMSFTSYVMVPHDERPAAILASKTYMAVAVIGGLAMLFGIFIINHQLGTVEIGKLYYAAREFEGNRFMLYLAAAFMLVGFGGKAGMYPIHIWLPNAHPVAPAPASALLSGVLTKTGIYGIIIVSIFLFYNDPNWGMVMLVIGVLGMFTGAFLALFSIDLKRTLACSSVSQIGFIIVGVAMQVILRANMADYDTSRYSIMPIQGTILHMMNHSLIKLVLFIMAGVVYMNLHQLDLNKVRGFGRGKPLFTFAFLMGVMGIIGIPFWNGYVSKTLLHESIVYHIHYFYNYTTVSRFFQVVESIFTLTGGLTTAYMIKIFTCVCIEKNQFNQEKLTALNKKYISPVSGAVLFICALLLPILGFRPYVFMIPIANFAKDFMRASSEYEVHFFAWANVRGAVASLGIGATIYLFVVRGILMKKDEEGRSVYVNLWPKFIDIENKVYKPLLLGLLPFIGAFVARSIGNFITLVSSLGFRAFMAFRNFWLVFAPARTGVKAAKLQADFEKFYQGLPNVNAVNMREGYEKMLREFSDIHTDYLHTGYEKITQKASDVHLDAEHLHSGYDKIREKSPHINVDKYREIYEKIRVKPANFMERIFGSIAGTRFGFMKSVVNSLAYSLLLFLIGALVIFIVVFLLSS
ncbi:MAG: complex I subunit 5 family protein [Treponema sp.]|nr:complex I subunit 5 family protein [Treponema sp.]